MITDIESFVLVRDGGVNTNNIANAKTETTLQGAISRKTKLVNGLSGVLVSSTSNIFIEEPTIAISEKDQVKISGRTFEILAIERPASDLINAVTVYLK